MDVWLVGDYLHVFGDSANLPTNKEVFLKFMFHLRKDKMSALESAAVTINELKTVWRRKSLENFVSDKTSKKILINYLKSWKLISKSKMRTTETALQKREQFKTSLNNLFDIGKNFKPKTEREKEAVHYLQCQREQQYQSHVITETISCSDFEEQQSEHSKTIGSSELDTSSQNDSQAESLYEPEEPQPGK